MVIPKSIKPARITENFDSTKITLNDEDMKSFSEINQSFRLCKVRLYWSSRHR